MRQEKIGRQINAGVLLLINEVELSIYKFLTLKAKKLPRSVELGANWLTIYWTINAWQVIVKPRLGRHIRKSGMQVYWKREDFLYLSTGPRLGRCNRSTGTLTS